jgi:hypothetical protein
LKSWPLDENGWMNLFNIDYARKSKKSIFKCGDKIDFIGEIKQ